jgi:hypothetical protein
MVDLQKHGHAMATKILHEFWQAKPGLKH